MTAYPPTVPDGHGAAPGRPPSDTGGGARSRLRAIGGVLPGLVLAFGVGQVALLLSRLVNVGAGCLALAIIVGVVFSNGPLRRWMGASSLDQGLRFVTARLLKLAVIMSGLKLQIALFDRAWLSESLAILVVTVPTSFVVAHFVAQRLRLRTEVGDLLAIGTMICGASAISALAPVIGAERSEQGLAITAVSTFSVVAMFVFLPVGRLLGLHEEAFGIWSGLAVGDFSTAVAVGSQFSDAASVVSTASKSLRVLLLGPVLVMFSALRRPSGSELGSTSFDWSTLRRHVPSFVVGYLLCCIARSAGDWVFKGSEAWSMLLRFNGQLFSVFMLTVCAALGLCIDWRTVKSAGLRVVIAGGAAAVTMAGVSLGMVVAFAGSERSRALACVVFWAVASACLISLQRRSQQLVQSEHH